MHYHFCPEHSGWMPCRDAPCWHPVIDACEHYGCGRAWRESGLMDRIIRDLRPAEAPTMRVITDEEELIGVATVIFTDILGAYWRVSH